MLNDPRRNERMALSMKDKLWFLQPCNFLGDLNDNFLEKNSTLAGIYAPDTTTFIDFGCGDGTLLSLMQEKMPQDTKFLGYDHDPRQIKIATSRSDGIAFTDDLRILQWKASLYKGKKALILSSVLHEIPGPQFGGSDFVVPIDVDYILIRDMFWGMGKNKMLTGIGNAANAIYQDLLLTYPSLRVFMSRYGYYPDSIARNILDFLLHLQYLDNIDHEVEERYLVHDYDSYERIFGSQGYERVYSRTYLLPYFREWLLEKYKIDLKDIALTHINAIYRKKDKV